MCFNSVSLTAVRVYPMYINVLSKTAGCETLSFVVARAAFLSQILIMGVVNIEILSKSVERQ